MRVIGLRFSVIFLISCAYLDEIPPAITVELGEHVVSLSIIEPGEFTMGAEETDPASSPSHLVRIHRPFQMMTTEVSQALFEHALQRNPSQFKHSNHPVERVSWFDAIELSNALSRMNELDPCYHIDETGVQWPSGLDCTGWRLPTEAEWEFAAKGNPRWWSPSGAYAGSPWFDRVAWGKHNSKQHSHPLAQLLPNSNGLYDMSGNVAEWVWDAYQPYNDETQDDPFVSEPAEHRISRGGGWPDYLIELQSHTRSIDGPEWRFDWVGVRLVRTHPK